MHVNEYARDNTEKRLKAEAKRRGITRSSQFDIHTIASEQQMQDMALSYVQKRKILLSDSASWCRAGKQEIAENSAIGQFLY